MTESPGDSSVGAAACIREKVVYNRLAMSQITTDELRKRAEADPNDEITHFSLGRALLDAGDAAEAAKALQRVIALNPNIAKAYQLLGDAQIKTGHRDYAI